MTYCVAMCVDEGLVFLSDTRTNAGVDHISTARKMSVFEQPGERVLVFDVADRAKPPQCIRMLERIGARRHRLRRTGPAAHRQFHQRFGRFPRQMVYQREQRCFIGGTNVCQPFGRHAIAQ